MYLDFYGLTAEPFRLIPDERFFYFSASRPYREAMARLAYGLGRGEGFVVITGQVGSGKTTTLSRLRAMASQGPGVSACVTATPGSVTDLLRRIALAFNIPASETEQSALPKVIENFLLRAHQSGKLATLTIDEAHHLTPAALDELRMICDIEKGGRALLQIILVGQPAFRDVLRQDGLDQFRQRVVASFHVSPMHPDETRRYIVHRLTCAGWKNDPDLSGGAFALIHKWSSGLPRKINLLTAHVLLHGSLHHKHQLDAPDVEFVCRDLDAEPGRDHAANGGVDDVNDDAVDMTNAETLQSQQRADDVGDRALQPCNENHVGDGDSGTVLATGLRFPLLAQSAPTVPGETPPAHYRDASADAPVTIPVSGQTTEDDRWSGTTVVTLRPPGSDPAPPPTVPLPPSVETVVDAASQPVVGVAGERSRRRTLPVLGVASVAAAFAVLILGRAYEETHTDAVFAQLAELRSTLLVSRTPATRVPPITDEAPHIPPASPVAAAVSEPAADRPAAPASVPPSHPEFLSAPEPILDDARAPAHSSGGMAADDHVTTIDIDAQPEAAAFRSFRSMHAGDDETPSPAIGESEGRANAAAPMVPSSADGVPTPAASALLSPASDPRDEPDAPSPAVASSVEVTAMPVGAAVETAAIDARSQSDVQAASRVVLVATAPCWTEVRGADGNPTFKALMKPGERFRVPAEKGMTMRVGNAGAMVVLLDGRRLPPVGGDGRVVGNIPLDPDRLVAYVTAQTG
jgi:type II secretory pathway predicted ATPase ExeA